MGNRSPNLDYRRLVRESKKLGDADHQQSVRIAILSDAATQQIVPLLKTLFHENSVKAAVYEGAFDAVELEAYNPDSELYRFKPQVTVLLGATQALRARYYQQGGTGHGFAESEVQRMLRVWDSLQANSDARIVQCNYPPPYERHFGHFDWKVETSLYAAAAEINSRIAACARERRNVLVCDVESVASYIGRKHWFDDRLWYMSKTFCALEHLPVVAQSLVEIVLATMGRVVKCVILDLDNTLWGGVVGDDGPLGVHIGSHGDGEPFYHFQSYLLALKKRGILLAVCSKNELANALGPFQQNPDMVLKREDITVFTANWNDKASNIRQIRDTLEIGFDSMVFLDDNPFERNLVREFLPDVIVPELPEDPADYVRAVSELNLFETSSFSAEDTARAELYKQEADRRDFQSAFSDVTEYLRSLDMRIFVERFDAPRIQRIAQLIQRSNQFNLTTHRYNESECERMMNDVEGCTPLYASLTDRFGDHGLISIVIVRPGAGVLEITDWLMSCRVLQRGVEQFLMNRVVQIARERGLAIVRGEYIPTAKNGMVKEFFAQFGFAKGTELPERTEWTLDVDGYDTRVTQIRLADSGNA